MIRCLVLISLLAGFEASVLSQISVVPGVQEVTPPFGLWDAIVVLEAESLLAFLLSLVLEKRSRPWQDSSHDRIR